MNIDQTIADLISAIKDNTAALRDVLAAAGKPMTQERIADLTKDLPPAKGKGKKAIVVTDFGPEGTTETVVPLTPDPEPCGQTAEEPAPVEEPAGVTEITVDPTPAMTEPQLRLAIQEYCKGRLTDKSDLDKYNAFHAAFRAELLSHGVRLAAELPPEVRADFLAKAKTW